MRARITPAADLLCCPFPFPFLLSRLFFGFACGLVRTTRLVVLSFLVLWLLLLLLLLSEEPSLRLLYDVALSQRGLKPKKLR